MDAETFWILGTTLGIVVLAGGIVLLLMPRGKRAETLVEAGDSFELQCAPADAKQYKLYARFGVEWEQGGEQDYGLIFELKVRVAGRLVHRGKIGVGRDTPDDVEYPSGIQFFGSSGHGSEGNYHKATVRLLELGPRAANSPILVTGNVTAAPATTARPTKIYIAR